MTGRTGGTSSGGCDLWLPYKTAETLQDPQNVAEDFARVERWASHISRGDCMLPKSWCGIIADNQYVSAYSETPIPITGPHAGMFLGLVKIVVTNDTGAAGVVDLRGYFKRDGTALSDHVGISFVQTMNTGDVITLTDQCVFESGASMSYTLSSVSGIDFFIDKVVLTLVEVNSMTGACCSPGDVG